MTRGNFLTTMTSLFLAKGTLFSSNDVLKDVTVKSEIGRLGLAIYQTFILKLCGGLLSNCNNYLTLASNCIR